MLSNERRCKPHYTWSCRDDPSGLEASPFSFERVTRRTVDTVTFESGAEVSHFPQIEECWYDEGAPSLSQYRWPQPATSSSSTSSSTSSVKQRQHQTGERIKVKKKTGTNKSALKPLPPPKKDGLVTKLSQSSKTNKASGTTRKSTKGGSKQSGGNLDSFFIKHKIEQLVQDSNDMDNHSISSRSMSSRSIADRSFAERSKAEESLKERSQHSKTSQKNQDVGTAASIAMHSIDEDANDLATSSMAAKARSRASPRRSTRSRSRNLNNKKTGLGKFLKESAPLDDGGVDIMDLKSVTSASTLGSKSFSQLSQAELSRSERRLKDKELSKLIKKPKKGVLKKSSMSDDDNDRGNGGDDNSLTLNDVKELRFRPEENLHEWFEIPELTNSMYDDLFYTEEELADFRYEAFMEEAGLDINEYQ